MTECLDYFTKTLTATHQNKLFRIPSWIPRLCDHQLQFDLDPPSYQQVTAIIRKMKASGSPCPLTQVSINISFKRCAYLRTYLTELIRAVWQSGSISSEWKKPAIYLFIKKALNHSLKFPTNHIESIPLKVFTSCLRNAMYSFLTANNFIEHNIQKGFTLICLALWNILHKWLIL